MIYIFSKFNKLIETCLNSTQNVQMQETLYRTIQWPLLKPAKRKKIQVVISIKMKIKHVHSQEHKSICHSADHLIKAISNKTISFSNLHLFSFLNYLMQTQYHLANW
jgi:hypothetical protein